jgi:hypothetical protein
MLVMARVARPPRSTLLTVLSRPVQPGAAVAWVAGAGPWWPPLPASARSPPARRLQALCASPLSATPPSVDRWRDGGRALVLEGARRPWFGAGGRLQEFRAEASLALPMDPVDRRHQDLGDVVERQQLILLAAWKGTSWRLGLSARKSAASPRTHAGEPGQTLGCIAREVVGVRAWSEVPTHGRRGLDIELAAAELVTLTSATVAPIALG